MAQPHRRSVRQSGQRRPEVHHARRRRGDAGQVDHHRQRRPHAYRLLQAIQQPEYRLERTGLCRADQLSNRGRSRGHADGGGHFDLPVPLRRRSRECGLRDDGPRAEFQLRRRVAPQLRAARPSRDRSSRWKFLQNVLQRRRAPRYHGFRNDSPADAADARRHSLELWRLRISEGHGRRVRRQWGGLRFARGNPASIPRGRRFIGRVAVAIPLRSSPGAPGFLPQCGRTSRALSSVPGIHEYRYETGHEQGCLPFLGIRYSAGWRAEHSRRE